MLWRVGGQRGSLMHWLLIAFVFNVSSTGELSQPEILYRGFPTEQACNDTGDRLREVLAIPETTKTISTCVDETAFHASAWKTLGVPDLPAEQGNTPIVSPPENITPQPPATDDAAPPS